MRFQNPQEHKRCGNFHAQTLWMKTVLWMSLILCSVTWVQAVPYYSLLVEEQNPDFQDFATELSRLWNTSGLVQNSVLVLGQSASAKASLEHLVSGQGDLSILDGASAFRLLKDYPQLRVISVLWPNTLHIVSKTAYRPRLMDGDWLSMKIHENALHFSEFWMSLNRSSQQTPSIWSPALATWNEELNSPKPSFFTPFNEDLLIFSGAYPHPKLLQLFEENLGARNEMQLIPLESSLLATFQSKFPWTRAHVLPLGAYAQQRRSLSLPVTFPVLVVRNGSPNALVRTALKVLFSQRNAIQAPLLFQQIKPGNNLLFRKDFQYHPLSKQRFRFR